MHYIESPIDGRHVTVTIEIPIGSGFRQIVQNLDEAGLIGNKPSFYVLSLMKNAHRRIHAGEYEFSSDMTPAEIIDKLVKGLVKAHKVTIAEDLTIREIAARLASHKLVEEKEFIALTKDKALLSLLNIKASSAEGYLYPNTYNFNRSMTPHEIIKVMVQQFWKVYKPEYQKRAKELGLSTSQVLTMASLIGKESGFKEEKPLIAAVFYNRLRKGMKLQSDPTAVYGLANFEGAVKKIHLQRATPYNTYIIAGLPPGPIANPGIDSILAALYPATADYLYFVSNKSGSHFFSCTFDSHREAIRHYQNNRKK